MKKLIRHSVFETNSSSSHSVSIADKTKDFVLDTIYPNQDGVIVLTGGEFGWEYFKHNDAYTKANYAAQALGPNSVLEDIIIEQTGANAVIFNTESGYIDHDSYGLISTNKETLRNFIFNKNSWLFGGNDNSEPDPTFYHVPEYKNGENIQIIEPTYEYELIIEGFDKTTKYMDFPTNDEIEAGLTSLLSGIEIDDDFDFIDLKSLSDQIRHSNKSYFSFNYWDDDSINFDDKICNFKKDTFNDAREIYRRSPGNENEDWSSVGYDKVKEIQRNLEKEINSKYVKSVNYSIVKINK
jgi:hypothetical protein